MTGTGVADGGDSSSVQQDLVNVVKIYSTRGAFAALRKDGTVRTWGNPDSTPRSEIALCLNLVIPVYAL